MIINIISEIKRAEVFKFNIKKDWVLILKLFFVNDIVKF